MWTKTGCASTLRALLLFPEEELDKVETLVNRHILAAESVNTVETDVEEAKKAGAMALFGEK